MMNTEPHTAKMHFIFPAISILCIILLTGCNRVPDYVIPPDDMAEVMADMHIAETVVENNYRNFNTDSAKMLVKQSILAKHGYTLEQLDTSFIWYGANLGTYSEVYDETIAILEDRIAENGAEALRLLNDMKGDSLDIWTLPRFLVVTQESPSDFIKFSYNDTTAFGRGDMFTLRAKFTNVSGSPKWTLASDYTDGSFEVLSLQLSGEGWHELTFYPDSLKTPVNVYGSINFNVGRGAMVIDSIQFLVKPLNRLSYPQRYRQRRFDFASKYPRKAENPEIEDETSE